VHVNLTRGLFGQGTPGAHVMKLNYTSLQHAVLPVEGLSSGCRSRSRRPCSPCTGTCRRSRSRSPPPRRARGSATSRAPAARCPGACRASWPSCGSAGCSLGTSPPGRHTAARARRSPSPARSTTALASWAGTPPRSGRPGDPRLGLGARPRRDGGARLGARRAGSRVPDGRRAADVRGRPARAPPRPLSSHGDGAAPAARAGRGRAARGGAAAGGRAPPLGPRGGRPRRLPGQRAADDDDGPRPRRGPAVLRRGAGRGRRAGGLA